jgi:uncharacterized repeat protein (TIGR01451 family)
MAKIHFIDFEEVLTMKIKHGSFVGLSALAIIATISFSSAIPVVTNVFSGGIANAQNAKKAQVELRLKAEKKFVQQDVEGKRKVTWKQIKNGDTVYPGEVLRYSVSGANNGDKAVKNLAINQPIPKGMIYVLSSASVNNNTEAQITYSIDGGKTYVKNPTVQVKLADGTVENRPAPDTAYTHIRWNFDKSIPGKADVNGTYQVRVR